MGNKQQQSAITVNTLSQSHRQKQDDLPTN